MINLENGAIAFMIIISLFVILWINYRVSKTEKQIIR